MGSSSGDIKKLGQLEWIFIGLLLIGLIFVVIGLIPTGVSMFQEDQIVNDPLDYTYKQLNLTKNEPLHIHMEEINLTFWLQSEDTIEFYIMDHSNSIVLNKSVSIKTNFDFTYDKNTYVEVGEYEFKEMNYSFISNKNCTIFLLNDYPLEYDYFMATLGMRIAALGIPFLIIGGIGIVIVTQKKRNKIMREKFNNPNMTTKEVKKRMDKAIKTYGEAVRKYKKGEISSEDFTNIVKQYRNELEAWGLVVTINEKDSR